MVRKEATARAGSGRREGTEMGRERKRRLEEQTEGLRKRVKWTIADKGSKIGGEGNERLKENSEDSRKDSRKRNPKAGFNARVLRCEQRAVGFMKTTIMTKEKKRREITIAWCW
jgi:hypothetical protein